jgi:DNA-binding response OmpR family regulator
MHRILIIEDELDVADLYRIVLEGEGYQVAGVFADPREALAWAEGTVAGEAPGLLIVDERLGGISGTAYLSELKEAFPPARILVATADPEAAAGAVGLGADLAIVKPFTLDRLRESVAALLAPGD